MAGAKGVPRSVRDSLMGLLLSFKARDYPLNLVEIQKHYYRLNEKEGRNFLLFFHLHQATAVFPRTYGAGRVNWINKNQP